MPPRLFLLRHGQSLANERRLVASSPVNAGVAFGLTPTGRRQVRESVAKAQAAGVLNTPIVLVSSPLLRARESAEAAGDLFGVTTNVDPRLSERGFGEFELEPDDRYERVWAEDRLDATHRSWGVESVADVLSRAGPVVDEYFSHERASTVILCTHGDVASVLICSSLSAPLEQHREVGALDTGALRELTGWVG